MKPITEQEKQELIKHCKRVMNESSPDGLEYPMTKIALASLTAETIAYTSEWALADVLTGDTGMMGKWNEVGKIPLYTAPPVPDLPSDKEDYFSTLVALARGRAEKAARKFPQPNYVLNKVAEESGEVIKAVIHFTEGREIWSNVENELVDNLAMLIRLVKEGDQVIGFNLPEYINEINNK